MSGGRRSGSARGLLPPYKLLFFEPGPAAPPGFGRPKRSEACVSLVMAEEGIKEVGQDTRAAPFAGGVGGA